MIKKRKPKQCLNVLCQTNPDDSSLWSKQKVMNSTICKACFDAFKSDQYCFFCYQIYLDQETSASNDGKGWIGCDGCSRWVITNLISSLIFVRIILNVNQSMVSQISELCYENMRTHTYTIVPHVETTKWRKLLRKD